MEEEGNNQFFDEICSSYLSRLATVNGGVDNEPEKKILSPAACG
jgi:hypothetical protein